MRTESAREVRMIGSGRGNTVSGGRLTLDLDSGRASIDGSGVGTTRAPDGTVVKSGGRVTGRFTVPDRN